MTNQFVEGARQYLFSVIMPVPETEELLEASVQSILRQTIGFSEQIQLILLDDEEEETLSEFCSSRQQQYPENIVVVKLTEQMKESPERSAGLPFVSGKYISLMGKGAQWYPDALATALKFLTEHEEEIDCVACRTKVLEREDTWDPMDFRFTESRIVDILENHTFFQKDLYGVIAKTEVLREYDAEGRSDREVVNRMILAQGRYGICKEAVYDRPPIKKASLAVENSAREYANGLEEYLDVFVSWSREKYGEVIPYVQYMIAYEAKHWIQNDKTFVADEEEMLAIRDELSDYMEPVDDALVLWQRYFAKEDKVYLLSMKRKADARKLLYTKGNGVFLGENHIFSFTSSPPVQVFNIERKENDLYLDGRINVPMAPDDYQLVAVMDTGNCVTADYYRLDYKNQKSFLGFEYHEIRGFKMRIPLDQIKEIQLALRFDDREIPVGIHFAFVSRLSSQYERPYLILGDIIIRYVKKKLLVMPYTKKQHRRFEASNLKALWKKRDFQSMAWRFKLYFFGFFQKRSGKELWLFMDKFHEAGDNAEYMFRYVCAQNNPAIKPVFAVSKSSESYRELKKIGKVISTDSNRYLRAFGLCDYLISSQTFINSKNTFCNRTTYVKDRFRYKLVYLQHGVIKDNHADTQSKHRRAVDLFITTGEAEYQSMFAPEYGYDESNVCLTGLARYDGVYQARIASQGQKKRTILVAPTWRNYWFFHFNNETQCNDYAPEFIESEFFKFYNGLFTDERVLQALRKAGCRMIFQLHPRIILQKDDFTASDVVLIENEHIDMTDMIKDTCLLLTDYSSIVFDYAYAGIPSIYAQFDKEQFYADHLYTRGYFDYEKDGFGEVCYDYESLVELLLKKLENHCEPDAFFKERAEKFFRYQDANNCKRIYEAILDMSEKRKNNILF